MLNKKVSKSVSTIVLLESASVLSLQAQKGNGPLSHSPVPKITENIITKGNETIFEKNSSSVVFLKFLTYMFIFVCVYGLCCRIERCLVLKSCDRYLDQYKNTRREKKKACESLKDEERREESCLDKVKNLNNVREELEEKLKEPEYRFSLLEEVCEKYSYLSKSYEYLCKSQFVLNSDKKIEEYKNKALEIETKIIDNKFDYFKNIKKEAVDDLICTCLNITDTDSSCKEIENMCKKEKELIENQLRDGKIVCSHREVVRNNGNKLVYFDLESVDFSKSNIKNKEGLQKSISSYNKHVESLELWLDLKNAIELLEKAKEQRDLAEKTKESMNDYKCDSEKYKKSAEKFIKKVEEVSKIFSEETEEETEKTEKKDKEGEKETDVGLKFSKKLLERVNTSLENLSRFEECKDEYVAQEVFPKKESATTMILGVATNLYEEPIIIPTKEKLFKIEKNIEETHEELQATRVRCEELRKTVSNNKGIIDACDKKISCLDELEGKAAHTKWWNLHILGSYFSDMHSIVD